MLIVFLSDLRIKSHNYDQTRVLFVWNQLQLPTSVCAFWPTCPPIRLSCSLGQSRNSGLQETTTGIHRCCPGRLHFLSVSTCILGFRRAASWFWRFDTSLRCLASNQRSSQHFWKPWTNKRNIGVWVQASTPANLHVIMLGTSWKVELSQPYPI